jgi:hypothetical protein
MRRTAGYDLLDKRRNEDILEELKVDPVGKKSAQYKQKKLLNHVRRMEDRYQKNSKTIDLSEEEWEGR